MRRGYIITWDALIALTVTLFLMLGFMGLHYFRDMSRGATTFETLHSAGENAIDTINKMGVLEEIGYYWSMNNYSYAGNLTERYVDPLIPKHMQPFGKVSGNWPMRLKSHLGRVAEM